MHDTGLMKKKDSLLESVGRFGGLPWVGRSDGGCDVFSCEYLMTEEEGMEAFVDTRIHHFADSDNTFA